MNEDEITAKFKESVERQHPDWKVQTQIPCGELVADGRIVSVDKDGVVKGIICYFEVKSDESDVKELVATGHGQAQYYAERSGSEAWLVLPHTSVTKFISSRKTLDPRVMLYDVDEERLIDLEAVGEKMSKSRMKRAMERVLFKEWTKTFTIETTSPIGLTIPEYEGDTVTFNLGQRIRGMLKEVMVAQSPTLAERIKYSVAVEPVTVPLCKKNELTMTTDYITKKSGRTATSIKRDIYNVPTGKKLTFTVKCLEKAGQLTPEIVTQAILKAGVYSGIGDAHSDGFHGRFKLIEGI